MPEIRFQIEWPDATQETCYSPSLVVQKYLTEGAVYALEDFLERSRTALTLADERVLAKYGMHCTLALGQLSRIEDRVQHYRPLPDPQVRVLKFLL
ncbi:MSMEG_0570 family nitrogen starvation response protein [Anthocerotibacter panamensis]|uniref:MSMEG_0570 family nitrogen starvation response protein n=1 Tax=Anthocerotibacter panamensis TaxID=2857077 RepID=UPI001C40199F|nr:MSMEG_0570 family nitrogen starvation response protein [Anthocerotibacter panamensis]